jgi:hypothetical protein
MKTYLDVDFGIANDFCVSLSEKLSFRKIQNKIKVIDIILKSLQSMKLNFENELKYRNGLSITLDREKQN